MHHKSVSSKRRGSRLHLRAKSSRVKGKFGKALSNAMWVFILMSVVVFPPVALVQSSQPPATRTNLTLTKHLCKQLMCPELCASALMLAYNVFAALFLRGADIRKKEVRSRR